MIYFLVFALFWVVAYIICLQQFIIASLTCMWYFNGQGDSKGRVSVLLSIKWGAWYHCGSIAMGSFLIALVTMIRVMFEYYTKKVEAMNKGNPIVKALLCCGRCCLYMLDKYVKFITKNAFI